MTNKIGTVISLGIVKKQYINAGGGTPGVLSHIYNYPEVSSSTGTSIPGGTKFVMLHFIVHSLPDGASLEIDLGYSKDIYLGNDVVDGEEFWTRPINTKKFAGSAFTITINTGPDTAHHIEIDKIARGESVAATVFSSGTPSRSNCDPFCPTAATCAYTEPVGHYNPEWFCHVTPQWQNIQSGSVLVREKVAKSVGMLITVEGNFVESCSVTCIDENVVITGGHCAMSTTTLDQVSSGSIVFNYEVSGGNLDPNAYFHKVIRQRRWLNNAAVIDPDDGSTRIYDYGLIEFEAHDDAPAEIPITEPHRAAPSTLVNTPIFAVHHPNGAPKKISPNSTGTVNIDKVEDGFLVIEGPVGGLDYAAGSSGSGIFNSAGEIVGVLSAGVKNDCKLSFFPIDTMLRDLEEGISSSTTAPNGRAIALVVDRSGSMFGDDSSGLSTKINRVKDALTCFSELLDQAITVASGGGPVTPASQRHKVGLVSFNRDATVDFSTPNPGDPDPDGGHSLREFDAGARTALDGVIGGIAAGGATSIGDGLDLARRMLDDFGDREERHVLLLTDGLENSGLRISDVRDSLIFESIEVNAIGYGAEESLNGDLLTELAQDTDGLYTRINTGLDVVKYFALAFGNIFNIGASKDPDGTIREVDDAGQPVPFTVNDEETFTVVVGWDDPSEDLELELRTPEGNVFTSTAGFVRYTEGDTWVVFGMDRMESSDWEGEWEAVVKRTTAPPPVMIAMSSSSPTAASPANVQREVNFFVNVMVEEGPQLILDQQQKNVFTGDRFIPRIGLRYLGPRIPGDVDVQITVLKPDGHAGTLLAENGLIKPDGADPDSPPPIQATLLSIKEDPRKKGIGYVFVQPGSSDPQSQSEFFDVEGNYTFHAVVRFGKPVIHREITWSTHVEFGIDPANTEIETKLFEELDENVKTYETVVRPAGIGGHLLGPGKADQIQISAPPGNEVISAITDNNDGSYTVRFEFDSTSGGHLGLEFYQPARIGSTFTDRDVSLEPPGGEEGSETPSKTKYGWPGLVGVLAAIVVVLLTLLLGD